MTEVEPPVGDAVLVARDVHKRLGHGAAETSVLRGVSLSLGRRELALLIGPSGSGKTTLLSILAGLLRPTAGEVVLCGERISEMDRYQVARARRRHVGFVFQTYNLFGALSALDNVAEPLAMKGTPIGDARARATRWLERVGLAARLGHRPAELSGGERQRVAIARALAGEASVVFGDEPTAALDGATAAGVLELLRGVVDEGCCSVLLVTHDHRVERWADRVLQLEDGQLLGGDGVTRLRAALAVVALLVAAGWTYARWTRPSALVDAGEIAQTVVVPATVEPAGGRVHILPAAPGTVVELRVQTGDRVDRDQVLAVIEVDGGAVGRHRSEIVATRRGTVVAVRIAMGDVISPATAEAVFELADLEHLHAELQVAESDASRVAPGQPLELRRLGGGPVLAHGAVARVAPTLSPRSLSPAGRVGSGPVRLAWSSAMPAGMVLGQQLEAVVQLPPARAAARVPRAAVSIEDGRAVVHRVGALWDSAHRVTLGASDDDHVELLDLPAGARVRLP